jgi:hypothetical protein
MRNRKLHKFIIITIIVPLEHDSAIRRENALGDTLLDDLRTLAPVRSPSSSSCRLHVLKSRQRSDSSSTGQGVGFASARRIRERGGKVILAKDVSGLKPFVRETWSLLEEAYRKNQNVLVEGTQGAALSPYHASYPHVTSRDTSVAGCLSEAGIPSSRVRKIVMVIRTYPIRVESPKKATSGPMDLEIDWETIAQRSRIHSPTCRKPRRQRRQTARDGSVNLIGPCCDAQLP